MPLPKATFRISHLSLACVIGVATASASGQVVSLTSTRDNTLIEDSTGTLSNGSGTNIFAGVTAAFGIRRGLLAFKLRGFIPQDAVITRAEVTLYCDRARGGSVSMGLHSVDSSWGEGSSFSGLGGGVQAERGDATWLTRFYGGGPDWRSAGGDFVATPSSVAAVSGSGRFYTWGGAGLVADVQRWLADDDSNHGWLLKAESEVVTREAKRFVSREGSNESRRPTLLVEYTVVPGPGVAAMGLIGSLFAVRRKRA